MFLFNNIDDCEKEKLLKRIHPIKKEYLRNEIIFYEGDLCNSIAIVNRGSVTAKQAFADGHDNIIRIINQNEWIGLNLIFSSNPFYKATFYSDSLTTITLISKDDLFKLMSFNMIILHNVLTAISDSAIKLNEHIKMLSHKSIRSRLCYYLYSEFKKNNQTSFVISYTKTELAAFLNVERPSLSNEMSKLINEGIIANQNKLYTIINLDKLKKEI
ncbi:MAG: Crp/Fnr family transcriptional regulator [Anaeroplasma sp.]